MTDPSQGSFEERLRAALSRRAASVSAPVDGDAVSSVATGARRRQNRRRWEAGSLALVVMLGAGLGAAVTSGGGGRQPAQRASGPTSGGGAPGRHHLARRDGVLILPLSGTVTASAPGGTASRDAMGSVVGPAFQGAAPAPGTSGNAATVPNTATATTQPIDVAPSPSASLQLLYAHTSSDGVQTTVFDQPTAGSSSPAASSPPVASGPPSTGDVVEPFSPGVAMEEGCLTTTQLTLEVSDVAAVGTATEPLFQGATGALVDVEVGEIGDAEGAPATWVLAQAGSGAATVEVQFADGTVDRAAVPSSGVVVLGHKGTAADALGSGPEAAINVLGADGSVLAAYGLGTESSVPAGGQGPTALPAPGAVQPADPAAASDAVTRAVVRALGCKASPLQRLQYVAGGDVLETVPTFGGSATVNVDKVVFTSATTAVVEYQLNAGQQGEATGPLYAAVTLTGSGWQLSLASVAPEIQVTPANQVGNVTVAPGGPLFVKQWPGGTAVAVYSAVPGSDQSSAGYGAGEPACTPEGGVVEEITTPHAVDVLTSALFPTYATPLIGAAVSTVGSAEGSPATVVGVEVGATVTSVSVTGSAGTVQESPVHGEAVIVLAGAPSTTLDAAGSELQVSDASGRALGTVSLQVDAAAPSGPSSLPTTLPAAGQGAAPGDAAAATQAITQAFEAVFDCATAPIQRVEEIQDGSLVAGALEELDTGPYEALASSTYVDVNQVVFESPTLADVSYVLRFHSDAGLTFPMIGQAVVVAGNWRVSYGTICAAVQLGLGNCQT
ncbi:MAG: hypothetical protein ABSC30_02450 [Acidimicrobiales bacterium]